MNATTIELEYDESGDFPGQVWHDANFSHVIVQETADTVGTVSVPGWYVRDEVRELGPFNDLVQALAEARGVWGEVTLAPANRLVADIAEGRADEVAQFLVEYLAAYGAVGIDVQALASRVLVKQEGGEQGYSCRCGRPAVEHCQQCWRCPGTPHDEACGW